MYLVWTGEAMGKVPKRRKANRRTAVPTADGTNILSEDAAIDHALSELGRILAEIAATACSADARTEDAKEGPMH